MAAEAAHLVDRVFPNVPVRQWVIAFPFELRLLLVRKADVLSAVSRIAMSVVFGWYRNKARAKGIEDPQTGAVSVVQRFGGSINLDVHNHVVAIDGVYTFDPRTKAPTFHFVRY